MQPGAIIAPSARHSAVDVCIYRMVKTLSALSVGCQCRKVTHRREKKEGLVAPNSQTHCRCGSPDVHVLDWSHTRATIRAWLKAAQGPAPVLLSNCVVTDIVRVLASAPSPSSTGGCERTNNTSWGSGATHTRSLRVGSRRRLARWMRTAGLRQRALVLPAPCGT